MYFIILFMRVKTQYCTQDIATQTHLIQKHRLDTISRNFLNHFNAFEHIKYKSKAL